MDSRFAQGHWYEHATRSAWVFALMVPLLAAAIAWELAAASVVNWPRLALAALVVVSSAFALPRLLRGTAVARGALATLVLRVDDQRRVRLDGGLSAPFARPLELPVGGTLELSWIDSDPKPWTNLTERPRYRWTFTAGGRVHAFGSATPPAPAVLDSLAAELATLGVTLKY